MQRLTDRLDHEESHIKKCVTDWGQKTWLQVQRRLVSKKVKQISTLGENQKVAEGRGTQSMCFLLSNAEHHTVNEERPEQNPTTTHALARERKGVGGMWGAVPQLPEQEVGAAFPPLQSIPAMHHEGQAELWGHLTLTQVLVTPLSPGTYQIAMFCSVSGLHQC